MSPAGGRGVLGLPLVVSATLCQNNASFVVESFEDTTKIRCATRTEINLPKGVDSLVALKYARELSKSINVHNEFSKRFRIRLQFTRFTYSRGITILLALTYIFYISPCGSNVLATLTAKKKITKRPNLTIFDKSHA